MTAGAILTLGLGPFGDVILLPTLGYLSGEASGVTATGGFRTVRDSYEEWLRRQERPEPPEPPRFPPEDDRLRDYVAKADRINASIAKVRGETAALRNEAETLRARITELARQDRSAAAAKAEKALLLKEQALQLVQAQEAMLLEQLEVLDVGYVALMAYVVATGLMTIN